ncbi:pentatricopeptide repeat-containing protein At4g18520, chloroplastic [Beta vulgaris subsp. vulgaris]|uniref:pentatricopeptide repeat-containing protein At4g18520, chloroplastic n=1 Tax=Beta vulgaris subsp. vulgaris TaxID=3555 RepID=UPI002036F3F3|nr:pentatricopeptide repeat-containing protein At4g18520, chloroplastic [Beta vulgaris subsp. vulgaris]
MRSLSSTLILPLHKSHSETPLFSSLGFSLQLQSIKHVNFCRNQSLLFQKNPPNFRLHDKISPNSADELNLNDTQYNPVAEVSEPGSLGPWVEFDPIWVVSVLQSRSRLKEVKMMHALILKCLEDSIVFVNNNLINVYLSFGKLAEARKVFDGMPERRNVVSWTTMINGYLKYGLEEEALCLCGEYLKSEIQANGTMFVCLLRLCGKRLNYELGKQVHACIIKGRWSNVIVDSAIVYFYAQCSDFSSAFRVFDGMKKRDVVTWTTMITACSQQGYGEKALSLFSQMLIGKYFPNEHTICSVLTACGEEKALRFGRQLHGIAVKKLIRNDVYIGTSLVDMYARCGEIEDSRKVFNRMKRRNMVTWTSIIAGYARNGIGYEALNLFRVMKRRKIVTNNLTIVSILQACGSFGYLVTGKEIHAQVLKNSAQNNIYIGTTLVWLYCKCGEYGLASKVLQRMPLRDVVSWTAIISGCTQLGYEFEAFEFLNEMLNEGVEPNPFTFSSVLKACASLEALKHGKVVHSSLKKSPAISNNVVVGSALINMYVKCGCVSDAFQVFNSMKEKNLVSWRSMIVGYATNGYCREALKLMYQMQAEGLQVDEYIVSTVLSACGDVEWNTDTPPEHLLQLS